MAASIIRLECQKEELNAEVALLREQARVLQRERDMAREEAKRATYDAAQETIKVSTVKSHWIEACRERDEAIRALTNITALPTMAVDHNVVRARKIAQEALKHLEAAK